MREVTKHIRKLVQDWDSQGYSAMSINCGNCDIFAQELLDAFPDGDSMWGEDNPELFRTHVDPEGHCFFKYHGKYYDSECPKGVDFPDDLPYYRRQIKGE